MGSVDLGERSDEDDESYDDESSAVNQRGKGGISKTELKKMSAKILDDVKAEFGKMYD